jgi:hypothetical protein
MGLEVLEPARTTGGHGVTAPPMTCRDIGFHDATLGHTTNPFGYQPCANEWREGYDLADEQGLAVLPRFGKLRRKR